MPDQNCSEDTAVLIDISQGIATLTLNRPAALNALNPEMAEALYQATTSLSENPAVRCVVIRGAGGHFMAGGDVGYFYQSLSDSPENIQREMEGVFQSVNGLIMTLRSMPQPVIASIEGSAAGFGISLVAACDLAIASDQAVFSLAYCHIGASPDGGASWHLPRSIGIKRSMELVLLGDRFDANSAERIGLINRVVGAEDLSQATHQLAMSLVQGPAAILATSKQLLNQSYAQSLQEQLVAEQAAFIKGMLGAEFAEGVTAFCEKRRPDFVKISRP